ncbi:MAG TPA: hypothetical protein VGN48_06155 [Pedococcus sp.]|jgi:phospholipase C|nr:hypothetical protein [Pedococcus sp.]
MAVSRIVVFLQENKTTDFYFASMAGERPWATRGRRLSRFEQPR